MVVQHRLFDEQIETALRLMDDARALDAGMRGLRAVVEGEFLRVRDRAQHCGRVTLGYPVTGVMGNRATVGLC